MIENQKNLVRIDKFLWAVRLFKTRAEAINACRSGKVRINGKPVKPSKEIKHEDILSIQKSNLFLTFFVKEVLINRVSAKLVDKYIEDRTPNEEYEKFNGIKNMKFGVRQKGLGRPTKKERRDISEFKSKY